MDALLDQYFKKYPPTSFLFYLGQFFNRLGKGDALTFIFILGIIFAYFLGRKTLLRNSFGGILAVTAVAPIVQTLKHLIGRARPQMNYGEFYFMGPNFFKGGFDSFPSGHAMASFALAAYLSQCYPRGKLFFYIVALGIGLLGRVALRHHFLTDVIGGAILGYLVGRFTYRWMKPKSECEAPAEARSAPIPDKLRSGSLWRDLILIFLIATSFLFIGLGSTSLWDRDETEYAQAILEMLQNKEWLIPTLEGAPFLEKPILLYWCAKISLMLFGTNDFAFRFPSALLGVLTCFAAYGIGRLISNARTGLLSALILSSSFLFIGCFRLLLTDSLLVFFTLISLFLYLLSYRKGKIYFVGSYLSIGLALLSKGPIALFPVIAFLAYEWKIKENLSFIAFVSKNLTTHLLYSLISLAVAAPWFLYSWKYQAGSASNFLIQENIFRFLLGSEGHTHSFLYHIPVLLLAMLPWSFFLISALKEEWKERVNSQTKMRPFTFLLLFWSSFLFVFFSLSAHKLPHYLAPILAPLSCFVAMDWEKNLNNSKRNAKSFIYYVAGSLILTVIISLFVLPKIEAHRVTIAIARSIKSHVPPQAKLIGYYFSEPSLFLYGGRLFPKLENEPLDNLLKSPDSTYIILSEKKLKESQPSIPYSIVERAEGFAENSGKLTLLLIKNNS